MGKQLVTKIRGIKPLLRRGVPLLLAFLISFACTSVSRNAEAAVAALQNWKNTAGTSLSGTRYFQGTTALPGATNAFGAVTAGTNRLMVVSLIVNTSVATSNMVPTVTYGGQALSVATTDAATSSRQHTWLFYLKEAGIAAAVGTNLSFTYTGNAGFVYTGTYANAAVYSGVDQTTPIQNETTYNSGATAQATLGPITVPQVVAAGNYAVSIIDWLRTGTATAPTVTLQTGWTARGNSTRTGTAPAAWAARMEMAYRNTAGTYTPGHTTSTANVINSMSAMVIRQVLLPGVANGATVPTNVDVWASDTDKVVDAFAFTGAGTTVNSVTITGNANVNPSFVSQAHVYRKAVANTNNTIYESGDVLIGTANPAASPFTITFSTPETVVTTNNYIITYDIAAGAVANGTANTLTGRVTALSPSGGTLNDTAGSNLIVLPTTSINDTTEPSFARVQGGSAPTLLDAFRVRHTGQSPTDDDIVTEVTVTLEPPTISGGTASTLSKIKKVEIIGCSDGFTCAPANTTVYGSRTNAIVGDTWNIPLDLVPNPVNPLINPPGFVITNVATTYFVRITTADSVIPSKQDPSCFGYPLTCSGYYPVSGKITGFLHTQSNNKAVITDANPAGQIAIDFEEPGNAGAFTALEPQVGDTDGTLKLTWNQATDPNGGALGAVAYKIVRGAPNGGVPNPHCIDGVDISTAGATINYLGGTATDVGLISSQATQYKYRICTIDSLGNISSGVTTYGKAKVVSSCNNPPILKLSPASQIIKSAGVVYALNVSNMDTGVCSDAVFNLSIVGEGGSNPAHFSKSYPATVTVGTGGTGHASTGANVLITIGAAAGAVQLENYTFSVLVDTASSGHGTNQTLGPVTGLLNDMPPIVHNSANMNKFSYGGWGQTYTCATCHSNSTTNIKGIFTLVSTPIGRRNVVFTKTSSSAADSNGVYSNDQRPVKNVSNMICSVCHHNTRQHQYSANKVGNVVGPNHDEAYNPNHNNSRDCVACHTHNTAFSPIGAACGSCHGDKNTGYAPINQATMVKDVTNALGPNPPGYGAHARHNAVKVGCTACHSNSNHAAASTAWLGDSELQMGFQVDASTFNGFNPGQSVTGGTFYGTSNLNYPYNVSGWVGGPGTTIAALNDYNNSCMTYCHGNWNNNAGNGSQQQPIWYGGSVEVGCGTCHYATGTTPPPSGSHTKHAATTGAGLGIACVKCHAASALANFTGAAHINGSVQWNLTQLPGGAGGAKYNGAPSGSTANVAGATTYGQCSNLYCHSNVQSGSTGTAAPSSYATPTWGGTVTCGDCHAQPNTTGNHSQHEANADGIVFDCHVCHYNGGTTTPVNHANGQINFQFTGLATGTTYSLGNTVTPQTAFGNCNSSCHGRDARTWGMAASSLTLCEKCHGSATSAGGFYGTKGPGSSVFYNESGVGMHDIHIQNPNTPRKATFASFTSFASPFGCKQCHYQPTGPFSSGHIDTALPAEAGFDNRSSIAHSGDVFGYYSSPTFNSTTKACNNIWCHGAGMNSNRGTGPYAGSTPPGRSVPKWNTPLLTGNRNADCNVCHSIPPPAPNSTYTHYGKTLAQCNECHKHLAATGLSFDDKKLHVNGNIDGGCGGCHGNPPITSDISNPANTTNTGLAYPAQNAIVSGVAGAHNTHALVPAIGNACNTCHGGASQAMPSNEMEIGFRGFSSQYGMVKVGTFTGYSAAGANPHWKSSSVGTTRSISPTVQDVTCANLYCHGNGASNLVPVRPAIGGGINLTPTWSGVVTCGDCHGVDNTNFPSGGSHPRHAATVSALGCQSCHGQIADNGTHVNASVSWNLDHSNPSIGSQATYNNISSGTLQGFAPRGIVTAGDDYRNCNNVYCHSRVQGTNGTGAPATDATYPTGYGSPKWGNNGTLGCSSCHKDNATDATAPGSHPKHANTTTGLGLSCGICHHEGGDGTTQHADNAVYVNFTTSIGGKYNTYSTLPGKKAGSAAYTTCLNTSCHGATSPAWGSGPVSCNSCHSANNSGYWATNSQHNTHVADATILPSSYSNMSGNVSSTTVYRFTCGSCHNPNKAKHSKGVYSANAAAEVFFGFSGNRRGTYTYAGSAQGTTDNGQKWTAGNNCQTTYCHSDGKGGNPKVTAFTWASANGVLGATCTGCHDGKRTSMTASTLSGKHDRHMNYSTNNFIGRGNGFNCVDCHAKTISNASNITLAGGGNKAKHINKLADYSGARANKGFNSATKECTNVYCHSNGNPSALVFVSMTGSKIWTGSKTITTCNNCHGRSNSLGYPDYANGGASTATSNLHQGHLAGLSTTLACADCHRKTADAAIADRFRAYSSQHLSGGTNVNFNIAKAYVGSKATVTIGGANNWTVTCSQVVCHGQGAPVWGSQPSGGASVRTCTKCHGNRASSYTTYTSPQIAPGYGGTGTDTSMVNTAASSPRVGTHQSHLVNNVISAPVKCGNCHVTLSGASDAAAMRSASHWNYSTATLTFNGIANNYGHTPSVSRVSGIMKCSNVDCHAGKYNSGTTIAPFWNNSGMVKATATTVGACVACHAMPPTGYAGHPATLSNISSMSNVYNRCGGCHSNIKNTATNVANVFVDKSFHINGTIEASGHSTPSFPGATHANYGGATTPATSCAGCHTTWNVVGPYPAAVLGDPPSCRGCHITNILTTVGTSSCNDCHGSGATQANAYPNGNVFPNISGSHTRHVVNQAMACSACHDSKGGGIGDATHGGSNRVAHNNNSFVNVTSATGSQFHFTWAGGSGKGTCSTNTCHATAEWGVTKLQCNSCHSYDSSDSWTTSYGVEGTGAHKKHIDYIKTRLNKALSPANDSFIGGNGNAVAVCGVCHDMTSLANHSMSTPSNPRTINLSGATRQFGSLAPQYNGVSGTSSSVNPKSCSNTDCHYRTSPIWSTY